MALNPNQMNKVINHMTLDQVIYDCQVNVLFQTCTGLKALQKINQVVIDIFLILKLNLKFII